MGSEREIRSCKGWRGPWARAAAAICLAIILLAGAVTEDVHAASYPFKSSTIYADGARTAKFTCNGMSGLCCDAGAYSTFSGTAALSRLKNTSNAARCAWYYGYCKGWTSGSKAHKLSRLLSWCMGNGTGGDFKVSTMKSLLKTAKKQTVPAGFECWLCKPKGSSKQDFIVWKYPKGKLKIVKKSAQTSVSGKGSYSLAGITIKVYSDAACKSCVKTLTTKKDGSTGGAFSLPVGTYYVKETKVPETTGFTINSKVQKVIVHSGKTTSAGVSNKPDTGSVRIHKKTSGEGGRVDGFRFILTSRSSGRKYTMKTGTDGTASVSGLPFGTYTLVEDLTEEQQKYYTDRTGPRTITIAKGARTQNISIDWENAYETKQKLKIVKRTSDGGPVSGFTFRISWLLFNSRQITGSEIAAASDPQVDLGEGESLGSWQIADQDEVQKINEAAKAGQTGTYQVVLKNMVTKAESGEDDTGAEETGEAGSGDEGPGKTETGEAGSVRKEIRCRVEVELLAAGDIASEEGEETPLITRTKQASEQSGEYEVSFHDLRFTGAADRGEEEGETDESGQFVMNRVQPGEYTVTELMSDSQKLRYRQPQSQKKTVTAGGDEVIAFSFVNEALLIPVRLQKASADGQIENVEFTLTGTPDHQKEPMEKIVVRTDEDGVADFGTLYPGTYRVEESGFDETRYADAYPDEATDHPGFAFTITGEELTKEEIEAGQCLWLGGDPGKGQVSAEKIRFCNIPYVDLLLTKVDGVTGSFLPGATFRLEDSDGNQAAVFRIDEDKGGAPELVMLQTNGVVAGEYAGEQSAESGAPIMIGRDRNGAQSTGGAQGVDEVLDMDEGQDADAERAQPAYACVSIHGLKEGEIYTLTEEKPPEGFTPLKEPYRFSVTLDENGRAELNTCDEYGKNIAGSEKADLLVVVNDGPAIGTKCLDDETGEHTAKADGAIHLTDTCTVTNLAAGETYTLIARLMDTTKYKTSGNVDDVRPVEGSNGEVTGKVTFTADGGETVIGVPIRADGADLSGKSTVVYEALYQGEVGVSEAERMTAAAEEADPNNEDQQIDFEGAKPGSTPATGNQFPLKALAVAVAAAAVMAEMGRRVYQRDDQGGY